MTSLSKIGEFGLIERFKKSIKTDTSVIKGSGDDCAVLQFDKDNYQLFTCDMLVEGVDFKHNEKPYLVGRKSIAVSISDIAACAGIPRYCLVSMGMPKNTHLSFVDALFKGMQKIAAEHKINLVGGDLSRSQRLTIDVSMLGVVEKKNLVLRSRAKVGDIIFTSGELGGSIKGKHLKFTPRVKEARYLVENFRVNSMIDISDGLAQDLKHILTESKVGALIYADLIPLSSQARGLSDALYMGEDFELLFTLSRSQAAKFAAHKAPKFFPIGEITSEKGILRMIDAKGRKKTVLAKGFTHF